MRSSRCIVDPLPQQRTAVDQVDGAFAPLVLVDEIAPQRIVRIQGADRLEGERLDAPRLERAMVIAGALGMNLQAVAELPRMFVKRGFEPALAQSATFEPMRGKDLHFLHDGSRI